MSEDLAAAILAAGHALCRERCAVMGEPPCWQVTGDDGKLLPWPPETCDCATEAPAAVASFLRALPAGWTATNPPRWCAALAAAVEAQATQAPR